MISKKPIVEQCNFGPWTVTATKSHILSSEGPDSDRYSTELRLPHLPEMVFPNNILRVEHTGGFGMEFNALDALRLVDPDHDLMKVACADEWLAARADSEFIKDLAKPFDWTFTTAYQGTLFGKDGCKLTEKPTDERIDIEKLKRRDKIQFYQDTLLFEDELSDHGCTVLNVKIRVMPTSFFILQRLYMRIDEVMVRVNDTRIYHEADWDYILREYSSRESKMSELKLPLHTITDKNEVSQHLPVKTEHFNKLCFPSQHTGEPNATSGADKSQESSQTES